MDLCQILKPLHEYDPPIIHRDIKPSNLILDSQNHLFLIDFDASKNYNPDKSRDTVLMGTEDYAAPEQYGFLQSSERTDIFSVGVLANKMLTGVLPSESRPVGPFQSIISKCLSIDPQDRYQDSHRKNRSEFSRSARFSKKIASQYGTFCYLVSFYLLFFPYSADQR